MYPPKLITYNLLEQTSSVKAGCFPVDTYEVCEDWLYLARPLVDHPYISYLRAFAFPGLGIQINRFFHHQDVDIPKEYTFYDYYIDVGDIVERSLERWVLRDLYLDIVVAEGKAAYILDTDEYLQAISEKLITSEEAHFALETTHSLVNGLAENGYNLESWLKQKGIHIDLGKLA
jgi:uncharacterized protein